MTDSIHRLPPQSLEAEMSILGGILLENKALNESPGNAHCR